MDKEFVHSDSKTLTSKMVNHLMMQAMLIMIVHAMMHLMLKEVVVDVARVHTTQFYSPGQFTSELQLAHAMQDMNYDTRPRASKDMYKRQAP